MVIQDPTELTYFDDYRYDGTSFSSKWEKGEPYKEGTEAETIDFSELKVDGFYKFYQQIIDYFICQIKLDKSSGFIFLKNISIGV